MLNTVAEIIAQLPEGWSSETDKPLLDPRYASTETQIQSDAFAALNRRDVP